MSKTLKTLTAAMAIALTMAPISAAADEIVLTSLEQEFSIRGKFVGFQQEAYVIIHDGKELRVSAKSVTCEGVDCLFFTPAEQTTQIASN